MLGEGEGAKWTISGDLYAQQIRGRLKISKFEVGGQLCNDSLDRGYRTTCQSDVINKDGNNDLHLIPGIDIDREIRLESLEIHLEKHRM